MALVLSHTDSWIRAPACWFAAILCSTSASDHQIFSFAPRGGWPCLHHAWFTEPLHSCQRGHNAFVQMEHLPPFCPMGCVLEEEAKVKVKVGCAVTIWVNVGCWLGGSTGRDDWLSSASKSSHPLFVMSNVDWLRSLSTGHTPFSKWARTWTDSDCIASPTLVAVLRPSNSSLSEKSSVIYEGQILCEKSIILYTYLAHYSSDRGVTVHAIL